MLTEALLLEQNKRLREENDELQETVRQLREQLAGETEPLPEGLPHLTRREAAALRAIMRRGAITRSALYAAIYGTDADIDEKLIDVWVCKLRRKLSGTGIRIATDWGRGFRVEYQAEAA